MSALGRMLRRRDQGSIDADLRTQTTRLIEVRIPTMQLDRALHEPELGQAIVGWDRFPPASGPESSITVAAEASTDELAERLVRRRLERAGYDVLASRPAPAG